MTLAPHGHRLLSSSDVGKLLDLTPDAVRRLVRLGELVPDEETPSGYRLYRESTVRALSLAREKRRQQGTPAGRRVHPRDYSNRRRDDRARKAAQGSASLAGLLTQDRPGNSKALRGGSELSARYRSRRSLSTVRGAVRTVLGFSGCNHASLRGRPELGAQDAGALVRLWRDHGRVEQLARLKSLEIQHGDYGQKAWDLAHREWRQLPEGSRIDLPSPRVFSAVLGLFRTGATLKNGKLIQLELSVAEIAEVVGYTKTTAEAALRWLGSAQSRTRGCR